jgi:hypothetical protein
MAKRLWNNATSRTRSGERLRKVKTPPGVWVIVGLGVFFVIIALGISAYIVFMSVGETKGKNALRKVPTTLAEGSCADTLPVFFRRAWAGAGPTRRHVLPSSR